MRRSRAEWRKEIARWRESGLTAGEYAAKTRVNARTLTYWKYILTKEARTFALDKSKAKTSKRRAGSPSFPLIELRGSGRTDERFEVELASGHRVRVPASFDADALRRLLATLEMPA